MLNTSRALAGVLAGRSAAASSVGVKLSPLLERKPASVSAPSCAKWPNRPTARPPAAPVSTCVLVTIASGGLMFLVDAGTAPPASVRAASSAARVLVAPSAMKSYPVMYVAEAGITPASVVVPSPLGSR
ncbi:MAG: hypothetical protein IPL07_16370 [Acidimicrobiaceae bacterium]|nr:hypothetical protein [Acidimicrobiaceae bacterium]